MQLLESLSVGLAALVSVTVVLGAVNAATLAARLRRRDVFLREASSADLAQGDLDVLLRLRRRGLSHLIAHEMTPSTRATVLSVLGIGLSAFLCFESGRAWYVLTDDGYSAALRRFGDPVVFFGPLIGVVVAGMAARHIQWTRLVRGRVATAFLRGEDVEAEVNRSKADPLPHRGESHLLRLAVSLVALAWGSGVTASFFSQASDGEVLGAPLWLARAALLLQAVAFMVGLHAVQSDRYWLALATNRRTGIDPQPGRAQGDDLPAGERPEDDPPAEQPRGDDPQASATSTGSS